MLGQATSSTSPEAMDPRQRLQHGLEQSALLVPDRLCLIDGDHACSYAAVDRQARRLAAHLLARGLQPGDRVVLLLPNSLGFVIAFFAALKADAIAVPLPPESSREDVEQRVRHCAASWLVAAASWREAAAAWNVQLVASADLGQAGCQAGSGALPAPTRPLDEPALILYTSGSTGEPKGVMLSHHNLVANTESILACLEVQTSDRVLAVLPFSYAYGLSVLNTHVWRGASLVLERRSAFPAVLLDTLAQQRVNALPGVPSTFLLLLAKGALEQADLPALRYLTCAGGRLGQRQVERLQSALPRCRIYLMYGATEAAARITCLPPERWRDKPGSIGRPIPAVRLEVRRNGGTVANGEEGEIWVSGPNLSRGYWPPSTPAASWVDGWYNTGDLGWRDDEGFFFLVGRANQLLKVAGHRVSMAEMEEALLALDAVADGVVVAQLDEVAGERAEAYVVAAHEGVSVEQLRQQLKAILPWFKRPAVIHLTRDLPRSASGKVLRHLLRDPQ